MHFSLSSIMSERMIALKKNVEKMRVYNSSSVMQGGSEGERSSEKEGRVKKGFIAPDS